MRRKQGHLHTNPGLVENGPLLFPQKVFSVVENEAKGGIMWDATFEICDHEVRPTRKLTKSEFEEILPFLNNV